MINHKSNESSQRQIKENIKLNTISSKSKGSEEV
jgi:hypothetical protein